MSTQPTEYTPTPNLELHQPTHGPELTYGWTNPDGGTCNHARIDYEALTDPRERALCRALLFHALALLDASEPARRTAASEVRR